MKLYLLKSGRGKFAQFLLGKANKEELEQFPYLLDLKDGTLDEEEEITALKVIQRMKSKLGIIIKQQNDNIYGVFLSFFGSKCSILTSNLLIL